MSEPLIAEFLAGESKEIRDLATNEAALVGFLTLIKGVDDLPEVNHRFYEEKRSLYQVTASNHSFDALLRTLGAFFGDPVKPPGKALPISFRFDPVVKYLGGVRKDQALFLKKLKTGSFFGALWPWQREQEKTEILLGYHAPDMTATDYERFKVLADTFLSKRKIESVSGVGGQIHGISLPSFLQMSEMEGATYALKVSSGGRLGYLHVDGGNLIAAQFDDYVGNEAAYRIISWENTAIQIEPAEPGRTREIHDSLMQVMMESLKIKDESEDDSPATIPESGMAEPPLPPIPSVPPLENDELQLQMASDEPSNAAGQRSIEETAPPLSPSPEVIQPFEKPEDHSIGKQHRMSRTQKLLVVLGVVIVFALAVTGGGKVMKMRAESSRYEQLQADLASSDALDERIVLLMKYVNAYPKDTHRFDVERQLANLNKEMEASDYEKTVNDVNGLPIDEKFEKKALSLYTAFLSKYPEGVYAAPIKEAIEGVDQLVGTAYFGSLEKVDAKDFLDRYEAYHSYLEQFPQNKERFAVERMILELANETADAIENQIEACESNRDWGPCITRCDTFLSAFDKPHDTVQKVSRLRSRFLYQKDFMDLAEQAIHAADDYAKARQIYIDYLEEKPETPKKEEILRRVESLTEQLARKEAWISTRDYAADTSNDIFSRIQRLESYLDDQASPPYQVLAEKLRIKLEPEFQHALQIHQLEKNKRLFEARKKAQAENRQKEMRRIQQIRGRVAGELKPFEKRYTAHRDGTVTDRMTGLTWCLLDSYLVLNKRISYETAKAYVQSLETGGFSDWRLPTAGELATIYKNSPFFPISGAPWYWSSESFARGFHRVVDVVTPNPEAEFKRISKFEDDLGAVRAVRR